MLCHTNLLMYVSIGPLFIQVLRLMNSQVWVSLTAYLQFVCLQPSAGPVPRSEIIGKLYRSILKTF